MQREYTRNNIHPALFMVVIARRIHPDKVAVHRAPRILEHAAKFPAVVQDEEIDVEFPRRPLVVGDLAAAVSVDNGLPCIDCRDDGTVETLGSATVEKNIRVAGTGPQQREWREGRTGGGGIQSPGRWSHNVRWWCEPYIYFALPPNLPTAYMQSAKTS